MTDSEIHSIVNALNQEPFNKGLTLLSFDNKTPEELIQTLQDVLEETTTDQKVDLRTEAPDVTALRMFDFLWSIKYKPPVDA